MKLGAFAALALSGICASFATGCTLGCDPGNNSVRAPVAFTPATEQATRTPATCGVVDPPFTSNDSFTLDLADASGDDIRVDVAAAASSNENVAVPLSVDESTSSAASASSVDGTIHFAFASGSDPTALDGAPITSVIVTVTALPDQDGQTLSAEVQVTFEDGRVLDQVYGAALETVSYACK